MAEYHNVVCPNCNKNVKAKVLGTKSRFRRYECPNVNENGIEPHNFSVKMTRWEILEALSVVAAIIAPFIIADQRNKNKPNQNKFY